MQQKTSLDLKLQEYAETLGRFEEAACVNSQEKTDLIDSYNSLSSQAEKLNATVQGMQDTLSTAKMELMVLTQVCVCVSTCECGEDVSCRRRLKWKGWWSSKRVRSIP